MKKTLLVFMSAALCVTFIVACAGNKPSPSTEPPTSAAGGLTLDAAISAAARQIDQRIDAGAKIAIVNFSSPADAFSMYVIDELTANLVESARLAVIDRNEIDRIRDELQFQVSGEVDDNSIQELGRVLGAQYIVTGSYTSLGELHRIVIRALAVQTAAVTVQYRGNVVGDQVVAALLAGGRSAGAQTARTQRTETTETTGQDVEQSAAATRQVNAQAQPANARIANGTYTFHPRLRPYQGATIQDNVYIAKIVVRGEYMSVYMTRNATGAINNGPAGEWMQIYINNGDIVLQNLDDPSKTWNPSGGRAGSPSYYDWNNDGESWMIFRGVTGRRFSLTSNRSGVPSVFEEIIIGEPDE